MLYTELTNLSWSKIGSSISRLLTDNSRLYTDWDWAVEHQWPFLVSNLYIPMTADLWTIYQPGIALLKRWGRSDEKIKTIFTRY